MVHVFWQIIAYATLISTVLVLIVTCKKLSLLFSLMMKFRAAKDVLWAKLDWLRVKRERPESNIHAHQDSYLSDIHAAFNEARLRAPVFFTCRFNRILIAIVLKRLLNCSHKNH